VTRPVGTDLAPRRAATISASVLARGTMRSDDGPGNAVVTYGPWRDVVRKVAGKCLACGILDHGFARVRCTTCAHEYLLAFWCKGRCFCPSCHAKRLAFWTLWLEGTLLAPVPHRQVVLTIPKRRRPASTGARCWATWRASPPGP
jgi:Transposase zinc-binding domain